MNNIVQRNIELLISNEFVFHSLPLHKKIRLLIKFIFIFIKTIFFSWNFLKLNQSIEKFNYSLLFIFYHEKLITIIENMLNVIEKRFLDNNNCLSDIYIHILYAQAILFFVFFIFLILTFEK